MIKLELDLTTSEANTLCTVLTKAIDTYSYCAESTVNVKWLWGLMADLAKAVVEENEQ